MAKSISKRQAKVSALIILVLAVFCLANCIYLGVKSAWLMPDALVNSKQIRDMKCALLAASFIIVPALSIMLILSARIIWKLSNRLENEEDPK
jgi:hypothetical protein